MVAVHGNDLTPPPTGDASYCDTDLSTDYKIKLTRKTNASDQAAGSFFLNAGSTLGTRDRQHYRRDSKPLTKSKRRGEHRLPASARFMKDEHAPQRPFFRVRA